MKLFSFNLMPSDCRNTDKMALVEISKSKSFGGFQIVYSHVSKVLGCSMRFGVYLPPQIEDRKLSVIYWLSGLTCTEANFIEKAGVQRHAAQHGVVIVNPDTSPRNLNIPGDRDDWDFGEGAGFYVDAKAELWKKNYNMYSYVTKELIEIVNSNFNVLKGSQSIMGHSMGGHGALICALKNPALYKSVSVFAAVCNPINCPLGKKAFSGYLGPQETSNWSDWDATELVKHYNGPPLVLLVDQGTADEYYKQNKLLPENLVEACKIGKVPIILKKREGYDHGYFYIASFIEEHIKHHMQHL